MFPYEALPFCPSPLKGLKGERRRKKMENRRRSFVASFLKKRDTEIGLLLPGFLHELSDVLWRHRFGVLWIDRFWVSSKTQRPSFPPSPINWINCWTIQRNLVHFPGNDLNTFEGQRESYGPGSLRSWCDNRYSKHPWWLIPMTWRAVQVQIPVSWRCWRRDQFAKPAWHRAEEW